ncbi:hypothetical protein HC081234_21220 [Helicobacter cinaedi]|nr:hypothetical protein HC081234_21220 [Helicobacter cinaedi]
MIACEVAFVGKCLTYCCFLLRIATFVSSMLSVRFLIFIDS